MPKQPSVAIATLVDIRRAIGHVPQMISADGNLTGYKNLLLFAKLYDIPRRDREQRIHEALELMGLEDAAGPDGARADGRASFAAARSRSRRSKSSEPGRA